MGEAKKILEMFINLKDKKKKKEKDRRKMKEEEVTTQEREKNGKEIVRHSQLTDAVQI